MEEGKAGIVGISDSDNDVYYIFSDEDIIFKERIDIMQTSESVTYGWATGDKIYLTEDGFNPETPLHEYTHLWVKSYQLSNPEEWNHIKARLLQNSHS